MTVIKTKKIICNICGQKSTSKTISNFCSKENEINSRGGWQKTCLLRNGLEYAPLMFEIKVTMEHDKDLCPDCYSIIEPFFEENMDKMERKIEKIFKELL